MSLTVRGHNKKKKKNIFKLNYYLDHMKRFHNVIRVDFMDIRAVKHRISGNGFFFVALPRKLQVNGFSISVLLFIIFLTCLRVNFSPQPRWQPAVGSCMWHQVADYQRCIAALTRGRPLLACCRPHSSPD